jgi:hypothetical protein
MTLVMAARHYRAIKAARKAADKAYKNAPLHERHELVVSAYQDAYVKARRPSR